MRITEDFSTLIDRLANSLYNPQQPGAAVVTGVLRPEDRERLGSDVDRLREHLTAPNDYGGVTQNFRMLYWGVGEELDEPPAPLPYIEGLTRAYTDLHRRFGRRAHFTGTPNNVGVHVYAEAEEGIGLHRDESTYRNLIGIFVLSGESEFVVAQDKHATKEARLPAPPGSLILMRAPRRDEERTWRPIHGVQGISGERTVVLYRQHE